MTQPPEDNQTEFVVHSHLVLSRAGEQLQCLVKATFELDRASHQLELAPEERRRPIRFADVPWGKPEISSIGFPADVAIHKPGTDVVVVAVAHAPDGVPTPAFDVYVRVGQLRKVLKVYGLRVWQQGGAGLSAPRPTSSVEMRYDNAWGGVDDSDPKRFVEEARNPVGLGVARDGNRLTHQLAPCIEDPAFPIVNAATWPAPAGIGPIGRHWEPRRRYTGTYDKAWKDYRAPLPPTDEDDRIYQCASPGLIANPPLRGNEACGFLNLTPGGGAIEFSLPQVSIEVEFRVKGREPEVLRPHLDTVVVDLLGGPDTPPTVELVWRASVKAPRKVGDSLTVIRERAFS